MNSRNNSLGRRSSRLGVACTAIGLAALLATASAAAKPKSATFTLEIKGEQLTTWNYQKQVAPSCDWPESASGRQYIDFRTYREGDSARPKVKAEAVPGGGVELRFMREQVTLQADAVLERTDDILYSLQSACPDPGSSGGTEDGPDFHGSARCTALGDLDFFIGQSLEEVESPSYPTDIADAKPPKAPIYFAADPFWVNSTSSDYNLPSACTASGMGGADIGITVSQGEWAGALVPVGGTLRAKELLNRKAKKTVVELGRTIRYPNAVQSWPGPEHTTGKTRIDLTMTFKRAR